jgi:predicted DNA-binding transcriptional regulator AlpA
MNFPRLRVHAAAKYLGLSVSTLNKYRVYGGGPRFAKLGPRIVVYDVADLDVWANEGLAASTSDLSNASRASARARSSFHRPAA